jgi:hypothetical protein
VAVVVEDLDLVGEAAAFIDFVVDFLQAVGFADDGRPAVVGQVDLFLAAEGGGYGKLRKLNLFNKKF